MLFFRCFFTRLDPLGQLRSAHETHITSTHCGRTHTILLHQRLRRMASCGPPPPRAAVTPAVGATAAARAATRPVLLQCTPLQDLRQVHWPWEEIRCICSYEVRMVGTRSMVPGVLNSRYFFNFLYMFCVSIVYVCTWYVSVANHGRIFIH